MAITLLIVGHANTGKTSLIRTLMRDQGFGCVNNRAGTTRHVEQITLKQNDTPVLHLIDTPGFEDSVGLWQLRQQSPNHALTTSQWLTKVTQEQDLPDHYEQELKILKQLPHCDIILYVIDLRQRPLGKYLNELDLLAGANKPIVPILNFCSDAHNHESAWRQMLAERQLHAHVRYDTVAFYFADERKLYQTLQSLAPDHYDPLQTLIQQRQADAELRLDKAQQALALTLIQSATCQIVCQSKTPSEPEKAAFQQRIRTFEQQFVQQCLTLFQFQQDDVVLDPLAIKDEAWQQDLFDENTLKAWGLNTTTAASAGAAIGAGIDLLTAGLSLGTATALGAMVGASWQTGRSFKSTLMNTLKQRSVLALQATTLMAMMARGQQLIAHLYHRGHASQNAYHTANSNLLWEQATQKQLERLFHKIGQRSEWQELTTLPSHPLAMAMLEEIQKTGGIQKAGKSESR